MPSRISLTVACDDFEIIRALKEGRVEAEGLDLTFIDGMTNPIRHELMVKKLAFDVCELNISTYLIAREKGVPITAFPVFLFRRFRHGNIFVRPGTLRSPDDLAGQRICCPNMQAASNVWIRGILSDRHNVSFRDVTWLVEKPEEIDFEIPSWMKIEKIGEGTTAEDVLVNGDAVALMSPLVPELFLRGDKRLSRLFSDYRRQEEAYFADTGIFPIMHITAIKEDIVKRHPWIPHSLQQAFDAAKALAHKRIANVRLTPPDVVWRLLGRRAKAVQGRPVGQWLDVSQC